MLDNKFIVLVSKTSPVIGNPMWPLPHETEERRTPFQPLPIEYMLLNGRELSTMLRGSADIWR